MGGELKNRVRFNSTVTSTNKKVFQELSDITRIPQSRLLDEALNDLFAKYENVLATAYTESIKDEITYYKKHSKILEEKRK